MSKIFKYADKQFATRKELHKFIFSNKEFEITRRKSAIKFSDAITNKLLGQTKVGKANKAFIFSDDTTNGVLQRSLLTNTYLWRDSYGDVHLPNTFTRSIAQKGVKIPPIDQHKFDLDHIIGDTLNIYEQPFAWKDLGVDHEGETIGVVADASIQQARSPKRYEDYLLKRINQHSVGMCYLQIACAIDSDDYPLEQELYNEWIGKLGNQLEVEEDGYFFAVFEAKLMEYSCVIAGANELTPVLYPSSDTTGKGETDSLEKGTLEALEKLNYKLNLNNLNLKLESYGKKSRTISY